MYTHFCNLLFLNNGLHRLLEKQKSPKWNLAQSQFGGERQGKKRDL